MTYLYVGRRPDTLANGRPLAFGDVVSGDEAATSERLIRAELLIPSPAPEADPDTPALAAPAKPKGRAPRTPDTDSEEE